MKGPSELRRLCRECEAKEASNWIRENLPAAIHRAVQSAVEHHQNALTSAVAVSRPSAVEKVEEGRGRGRGTGMGQTVDITNQKGQAKGNRLSFKDFQL